jgi:hypothetical protein
MRTARSANHQQATTLVGRVAPEVEIISEAVNDADRLNPYPRNSEETVADEAYVCKELPIVTQCRETIKKTWPEMKAEFGKHIGVTLECFYFRTDKNLMLKLLLPLLRK